MDSILTSIKKMLGIEETYAHFDQDLIIHINSVFMILNRLGIGPKSGFSISDKYDLWEDFLKNTTNLEAVKSYMYLKVRLLFDPPQGSVLESFNRSISELEWSLNVMAETKTFSEEQEG